MGESMREGINGDARGYQIAARGWHGKASVGFLIMTTYPSV